MRHERGILDAACSKHDVVRQWPQRAAGTVIDRHHDEHGHRNREGDRDPAPAGEVIRKELTCVTSLVDRERATAGVAMRIQRVGRSRFVENLDERIAVREQLHVEAIVETLFAYVIMS